MQRALRRLGIVIALLGAVSSAPAWADQTDPGDLAFWQSIQNSTNPAEYEAYLKAYPTGRFAALARIRFAKPPAAAAPAVAAAPAAAVAAPAAAPGTAPIVGDGTNKIVIQPAIARVGQKLPNFDPQRPPADVKLLYVAVIYSRSNLIELPIGPFAPGNYEARYYTTLYNNDHRFEISARTAFSVR
jgi:hypothetical protein